MIFRLTTDLFIEKVKKVQGDKYDYSKVVYKNSKTKVEIVCPKHGSFWQTPDKHMQGQGCPKCKNESFRLRRFSNTSRFSEKAALVHNGKYDYSKVNYITRGTKVKIICPKHGDFEQEPRAHLAGQGCPACAKELNGLKRRISPEEYIAKVQKVHNNRYTYTKTKYSVMRNTIIITCPKHGDFEQVASEHLEGAGCPRCNFSHGEQQIDRFLYINKINYIPQYKIKGCTNRFSLPFDFAIFNEDGSLRCLIEYHGKQHFEPIEFFGGLEAFKKQQKRDKIKRDYCMKNNIKLYTFSYKEDLIKKLEEIKTCLINVDAR